MTTVRMDAAELAQIHNAILALQEKRSRLITARQESQRLRLREAAEDVAERVFRKLPDMVAEMSLDGPGGLVILKGATELERAAIRPLLDLGEAAQIRLHYGKLIQAPEPCVVYVDTPNWLNPDNWVGLSWPDRV